MKLLIFILVLGWAAGAFPCGPAYRQLMLPFPDLDRPGVPLRGQEVNESTRDLYLVSDPAHEDFSVSGVVKKGDLYLRFQTKTEEGQRSSLRAREHFPRILDHFKGRFTRVMGQWQVGPMTTNLDTFNWLSRTMSLEEAARRTWTGRQAVEAGYTKVTFVTLEGRPGGYTRVLVAFEKP